MPETHSTTENNNSHCCDNTCGNADDRVVPDSVVWSFCIFIPGVSPRNPLPEGPEELSYAILCQSELAGASHACLIISSEADEGGAIISSGSSERSADTSFGHRISGC